MKASKADADKLVEELQEVLGELRKSYRLSRERTCPSHRDRRRSSDRANPDGRRKKLLCDFEPKGMKKNGTGRKFSKAACAAGMGDQRPEQALGDNGEKMEEWCKRHARRCKEYWAEKVSREEAERRYRILYPMTEIQAGEQYSLFPQC